MVVGTSKHTTRLASTSDQDLALSTSDVEALASKLEDEARLILLCL